MSVESGSVPEKKPGLWIWLLGLFAAGVALLAVLALGLAWYIARNVQRSADGNRVEIQTPIGSLKVDKHTPVETGLPVYPGATTSEMAATVAITPAEGDAVDVTAARFTTADSIDKVDEWYREKLGPEFTREGAGQSRRKKEVFGIAINDNDVAFISEKDDLMRVVAIERKATRVEIALVRIGKAESQ